jgi:hypothetical protein
LVIHILGVFWVMIVDTLGGGGKKSWETNEQYDK